MKFPRCYMLKMVKPMWAEAFVDLYLPEKKPNAAVARGQTVRPDARVPKQSSMQPVRGCLCFALLSSPCGRYQTVDHETTGNRGKIRCSRVSRNRGRRRGENLLSGRVQCRTDGDTGLWCVIDCDWMVNIFPLKRGKL